MQDLLSEEMVGTIVTGLAGLAVYQMVAKNSK